MNLPDGWKSVPLGEILTEEQIKVVQTIVETSTDSTGRIQRLKRYLNGLPLEKEKGVVPDHLAWAIEAKLQGIV